MSIRILFYLALFQTTSVFIVELEYISHFFLVLLMMTLNIYLFPGRDAIKSLYLSVFTVNKSFRHIKENASKLHKIFALKYSKTTKIISGVSKILATSNRSCFQPLTNVIRNSTAWNMPKYGLSLILITWTGLWRLCRLYGCHPWMSKRQKKLFLSFPDSDDVVSQPLKAWKNRSVKTYLTLSF